jgi:hypothetical protein
MTYLISKLKISLFFLLILLINFSCSQKKYEKEKSLKAYLLDIQHFDLEGKNTVLVILQTNFCGTCNDLAINLINQLNKNKINFNVLITENNDKIINRIELGKDCNLFIDENYMMEEYGITTNDHELFDFRNGDIKYWNYINYSTIKSIEKHSFKISIKSN